MDESVIVSKLSAFARSSQFNAASKVYRHAFADVAKLTPYLKSNIACLMQAPSLPSSKTVEDLFLQLDPSQAEPILTRIFSSLLRSKFFFLFPERLKPPIFQALGKSFSD